MKLGLHIPNADDGLDPLKIVTVAEELGFESLFVPEHSHIPVRRESAFPGQTGLLPEYYHMQDPFVTLAAMAMVTKTINLGTGICIVPQHHPINLAKTVATLDQFSKGRVLFGIGQGWNNEEMRNIGIDPQFKLAIMTESVKIMKELWTKDEPEYHGRFFSFDPILCWPKPLQKPHPPVLVAGSGESVLRRVVDYGDGWYPVANDETDTLKARVQELQKMAAAAGRGRIPVTIGTRRDDLLDFYAEAGIDRVLFRLPAGPTDLALELMSKLAKTGPKYLCK